MRWQLCWIRLDCGLAFWTSPRCSGWTYDIHCPSLKKNHRIRRNRPMWRKSVAVAILQSTKRPLIIIAGGINIPATAELRALFKNIISVVETTGRANLRHDHPLNCGPIGVTGSNSANALAERRMSFSQSGHACKISPRDHGPHFMTRHSYLSTGRFDAANTALYGRQMQSLFKCIGRGALLHSRAKLDRFAKMSAPNGTHM